MKKTKITTGKAPAAIGPYSQAVNAGGFIFVSGQMGLDPVTGKSMAQDAAGQARQALVNIRSILEEAGANMEHVVKCTMYLAAIEDFPEVNKVFAEFFITEFPARATVAVAALPLGMKVQIDAIALA